MTADFSPEASKLGLPLTDLYIEKTGYRLDQDSYHPPRLAAYFDGSGLLLMFPSSTLDLHESKARFNIKQLTLLMFLGLVRLWLQVAVFSPVGERMSSRNQPVELPAA